jgi:hypothetical protein
MIKKVDMLFRGANFAFLQIAPLNITDSSEYNRHFKPRVRKKGIDAGSEVPATKLLLNEDSLDIIDWRKL